MYSGNRENENWGISYLAETVYKLCDCLCNTYYSFWGGEQRNQRALMVQELRCRLKSYCELVDGQEQEIRDIILTSLHECEQDLNITNQETEKKGEEIVDPKEGLYTDIGCELRRLFNTPYPTLPDNPNIDDIEQTICERVEHHSKIMFSVEAYINHVREEMSMPRNNEPQQKLFKF